MSPEDKAKAQDEGPPEPPPGSIADLFREALPKVEFGAVQGVMDVLLLINRDDAHTILETAKNDAKLGFDFLSNLSGVDFEAEGMEVVYHLYSYKLRHSVTIRAHLASDDLHIRSVSDLWNAADWHEREARDMFGIDFVGHPNLVPLLLPEDMLDHHPLRKDNPLAPLEEWQGELLGSNVAKAGYIPPGSGFKATASEEEEE